MFTALTSYLHCAERPWESHAALAYPAFWLVLPHSACNAASASVSQNYLLYPCAGDEPSVMMDAHCEAGFVVGVPFAARGLYDFGQQGGMTSR